MNPAMPVLVNPSQLQEAGLLEAVVNLIAEGEAVNRDDAHRGVSDAEVVAYVLEGDKVVSTGTVKIPTDTYKEHVSTSSGFDVMGLGRELGYIATSKTHEGRRHASRVIDALVPRLPRRSFATTHLEKNSVMHHLLEKHGFVRKGEKWPSGRIAGRTLELWARELPA